MKQKKLLLLGSIFFLCSCSNYGSYSFKKGKMNFSSSEISASYEDFHGYIIHKVSVKEEETISFQFTCQSLETNEGLLQLELMGDKEEKWQDLIETEIHFDLVAGSYKIKIIGDHHDGSFNLTWNSEKKVI